MNSPNLFTRWLFVFFLLPCITFSQSYTVTLNILNTPNENNQVVVIAGTDLEVEFIIIDDDKELSSNDIIRLVKLSTNEILAEKKRGKSLNGSVSLKTNGSQGNTDLGECVVEYVNDNTVMTSVPDLSNSLPIVLVADEIIAELIGRIEAVEDEIAEGGIDGIDGKSAYELWLEGNEGTLTDFLASLVGPKGDPGADGDKGDKGDQGDVGPQGPPGSGYLGKTCPDGQYVAGFDDIGGIICRYLDPPPPPPETYTVIYDGNGNTGGEVPIDVNNYTSGQTVTVLGNTGSLENGDYLFADWNTQNDGNGAYYAQGMILTIGAEDVILYARWIALGEVTDIDGNIYNTIKIGNQEWMVENLKTTRYNDGTAIPLVTDNTEWINLTTPGYCWYNNDIANKARNGALYNWHTVNTGKLAPAGWHVPTDQELVTLQNYLIANGYNWDGTQLGNKIAKSMATKTDWTSYDKEGTVGNNMSSNNRSGFSALPGGYRNDQSGNFLDQGRCSYWWSATESAASRAYSRTLGYTQDYLYRYLYGHKKNAGYYVRLLRD